jgi:hypothetical protein
MGEKKLGGQKEICPTFLHLARLIKKIFNAKFPQFLSMGGGAKIFEELKIFATLHISCSLKFAQLKFFWLRIVVK